MEQFLLRSEKLTVVEKRDRLDRFLKGGSSEARIEEGRESSMRLFCFQKFPPALI
jgi:hypothetical protein